MRRCSPKRNRYAIGRGADLGRVSVDVRNHGFVHEGGAPFGRWHSCGRTSLGAVIPVLAPSRSSASIASRFAMWRATAAYTAAMPTCGYPASISSGARPLLNAAAICDTEIPVPAMYGRPPFTPGVDRIRLPMSTVAAMAEVHHGAAPSLPAKPASASGMPCAATSTRARLPGSSGSTLFAMTSSPYDPATSRCHGRSAPRSPSPGRHLIP